MKRQAKLELKVVPSITVTDPELHEAGPRLVQVSPAFARVARCRSSRVRIG